MAVVGKVYLVGAGPGHPGLITVRGSAILQIADVVLYDHLSSFPLLDLAPASALKISVGKRSGHYGAQQTEIHELLIQHARQGKTVVRLKGGDPYVFGRGAEEAEVLHAAGIPFEVVPGITAGVGVTSWAGIPLTHREDCSAVAFVTGHASLREPGLDWSALARFPGTLVIYMGSHTVEAIRDRLLSAGKDPATPVAAIRAGTLPHQATQTATLATLSAAYQALAPQRGPTLFVIGTVVNRRSALAWWERLPLAGQTIVVTRPVESATLAIAELEALGANVLHAPLVTIHPLEDPTALDATLRNLTQFDWLVFTSAQGVDHCLQRLRETGRDLRALGRLKLAAIGPATGAALQRWHLQADLVPHGAEDQRLDSDGLVAALKPHVAGQQLLLARADRGRQVLVNELASIAHVDQVTVYHNRDAAALPGPVRDALSAGEVDWVTLTSSAGADRWFDLLPADLAANPQRQPRIASLSPVTSTAIRQRGGTIAAEPTQATWSALVTALVATVTQSSRSAPPA